MLFLEAWDHLRRFLVSALGDICSTFLSYATPLQRPAEHLQRSSGYPSPSHLASMTRWQHRNINLFTIAYASRPQLRLRLTLGGLTCPRKPWIFGGSESHRPYRYSYRHQHSQPVQQPFRSAFSHVGTLLYRTSFRIYPWLRYQTWAPLHFRRSLTWPVSYYAFFKGWLLLSQPPGCFSNSTSFST